MFFYRHDTYNCVCRKGAFMRGFNTSMPKRTNMLCKCTVAWYYVHVRRLTGKVLTRTITVYVGIVHYACNTQKKNTGISTLCAYAFTVLYTCYPTCRKSIGKILRAKDEQLPRLTHQERTFPKDSIGVYTLQSNTTIISVEHFEKIISYV